MKIKLLPLLLLFIFSKYAFPNTCTTTAGTFGSWAALTWTCTSIPTSGPPGCGDIMNIGAGTTVSITSTVDYSACATPIQLNIFGTMDFPSGGVRFKLPPGSSVFVASGGTISASFSGGGSSTLISVGGVNVWTAGDGTITGPIVLPIELLSFTATPKAHSILVEWVTATEINNDYYTLERSTDGYNFQVTGTIDGAGNSIAILHYPFEDLNPQEGTNYYRLKQTDFNGHSGQFGVISVEYHPAVDFSMSVFPNPNNGSGLNVVINSPEQKEITIEVVDLVGRVMHSTSVITGKKGNNTFTMDFRDRLAPGMYTITSSSGPDFHIQKLVIN